MYVVLYYILYQPIKIKADPEEGNKQIEIDVDRVC